MMRKLNLLLAAAGVVASLCPVSSWASQTTLFVDPENGTDASNTTCGESLATASTGPCATLNNALANAAAGATIFITRPGVFGPIIANQNISIVGPDDGQAAIAWSSTLPGCVGGAPGSCNGSAAATYAVDIQAGASNGNVKFKHIIINANGASAAALHVTTAFVVTLTSAILRCGPGSSTPQELLVDSSQGSQLQLYLHKSDFAFCSGGGGMTLAPSGATLVKVNIDGGEFHNMVFGIQGIGTSATTGGGVEVVATDSQFFSFNNSAVSLVGSSASVPAVVGLVRTSVVNTGAAALKVNGAGAGAFLDQAVFVANAVGVNVVGAGTAGSYQNNVFQGNGINCAVSGVNTPCSTALGNQTFN